MAPNCPLTITYIPAIKAKYIKPKKDTRTFLGTSDYSRCWIFYSSYKLLALIKIKHHEVSSFSHSTLKNLSASSSQGWHMPSIWETQASRSLWVQSQLDLQSEFKDSQSNTENHVWNGGRGHLPLIPVPERQRQVDLYEFETRLDRLHYISHLCQSRLCTMRPCLQNKNKNHYQMASPENIQVTLYRLNRLNLCAHAHVCSITIKEPMNIGEGETWYNYILRKQRLNKQ